MCTNDQSMKRHFFKYETQLKVFWGITTIFGCFLKFPFFFKFWPSLLTGGCAFELVGDKLQLSEGGTECTGSPNLPIRRIFYLKPFGKHLFSRL